jgi:hypothetical protein
MLDLWDNESEAVQCVNTERPLTHSLDLTEEGIAVKATRKCTVEGCDKPNLAKNLCGGHYSRLRTHGDPLAGRAPRSTTGKCTLDDCDGELVARGLCDKHYTRLLKHGDPMTTLIQRGATCSIDECTRPSSARTWCSMHYSRWVHTGSPLKVRPKVIPSPGEAHPSWQGDQVGYTAAHLRVKNLKGPASNHLCIDCAEQASNWSYDHLDPNEKTQTRQGSTLAYSANPDHYKPRCLSCHRKFDSRRRA